MLTAENLYVQGRRSDLLAPTSLAAAPGDILLVQADDASSRTALALTLSGRMKPTSGTLEWSGDRQVGHLRRRSALVDSPDVNEPELHLRVKDLVAEDLALIPRAERPRISPARWLQSHGFTLSGNLWIEQVPPEDRISLLLALALADSRVEILVLDSPDRHQGNPGAWLPALQDAVANAGSEAAAHPGGRRTAGRHLTVIAAVAQFPPGWDGPTSRAGNAALTAPSPAETPGEPETPSPADNHAPAAPGTDETEVTA